MAERAGFEPAVRLPLHTLSKRAPSTTRTPLRLWSLMIVCCAHQIRKPLARIIHEVFTAVAGSRQGRQLLNRKVISGPGCVFSRGFRLRPGPHVVRRAAALHLAVYVFSQFDVLKADAFAIHGIKVSPLPGDPSRAPRRISGRFFPLKRD